MDNLKSKTKKELQEYVELQYKNLSSANKRINELESENSLLRQQVAFGSKPQLAEKTTEEKLCEIEIDKLYGVAQTRPLNSAETKQLEIYIKSLHICKNKKSKTKPKDVASEEIDTNTLVKYASLPES